MSRRERGKLSVRTLPLLRDDLASVSVFPGLADAELWWVTAPMVEVVHAAFSSIPVDGIPTEMLPSSSGILIWERGLGHTITHTTGTPGRRKKSEVTGAFWTVTLQGVVVVGLVKDPTAPLGVSGAEYGGMEAEEIDATLTMLGGALVSSWVLASQPTIGQTHREYSALRRAGLPRRPDPLTITVATLRESLRAPGEPAEKAPGGRELSVRFLVRGHWRNQVCGPARSKRKPVWVAPFVKGPEGAPFKETDLVKVWRR
ncbi:hypothetical protein [Arcanobacterium canis]